jgi:hypothetical protein
MMKHQRLSTTLGLLVALAATAAVIWHFVWLTPYSVTPADRQAHHADRAVFTPMALQQGDAGVAIDTVRDHRVLLDGLQSAPIERVALTRASHTQPSVAPPDCRARRPAAL